MRSQENYHLDLEMDDRTAQYFLLTFFALVIVPIVLTALTVK